MRDALNADEIFRFCIGPGCSSGQYHPEGEEEPIFSCNNCGHKACVIHNCNWHEGETCVEYDKKLKAEKDKTVKQEKASEKVVKKISKACPHEGCGWRIEKASGCDHMTCR